MLRVDAPRRRDMAPGALADTLLGKRSCTLDLTTPAGDDLVHALLDQADVLVHGYRPGALDRFGLSPQEIAERHPGTVVVIIDAWGHTGPWSGRRGFDSVVQAATGLAAGESSIGPEPGALSLPTPRSRYRLPGCGRRSRRTAAPAPPGRHHYPASVPRPIGLLGCKHPRWARRPTGDGRGEANIPGRRPCGRPQRRGGCPARQRRARASPLATRRPWLRRRLTKLGRTDLGLRYAPRTPAIDQLRRHLRTPDGSAQVAREPAPVHGPA